MDENERYEISRYLQMKEGLMGLKFVKMKELDIKSKCKERWWKEVESDNVLSSSPHKNKGGS